MVKIQKIIDNGWLNTINAVICVKSIKTLKNYEKNKLESNNWVKSDNKRKEKKQVLVSVILIHLRRINLKW